MAQLLKSITLVVVYCICFRDCLTMFVKGDCLLNSSFFVRYRLYERNNKRKCQYE